MSVFQVLGISLFGVLIAATVGRMIRRRSVPRSSLAWLVIWTAGTAALLSPDGVTRLARILGVSRGADLLLYVSVLSGLGIAFIIYVRMRATDRQITLIVRQLALASAEAPLAAAGGVGAGEESYDAHDGEDPFFAKSASPNDLAERTEGEDDAR